MREFFEDYYGEFLSIIFVSGVFLIAIFLLIPASCSATKKEINTWNNGIHKDCGGHWQYEQAVGHQHTTEYIYICDKCNVRETFREIR